MFAGVLLALWVLKIMVCDVPALRLGFALLGQHPDLMSLRIISTHSYQGSAGRQIRLRMLANGDSHHILTDTLTQYSLPMTGLAWHQLRPGVRLPALRGANGKFHLVATSVSHSDLLEAVGGLADLILIMLYVWAFCSSRIVPPGLGGEGWGCVAVLVVGVLPLVRELAMALLFPFAAAEAWFMGWQAYLIGAVLSALVSPFLVVITPVMVFLWPKFKTGAGVAGDFMGPGC
jgi:hypothetical protein